ncbi:hypothetical protein GCM10023200_50180 [Actinomycetospora chlora]|uniref:Uncharacterized protein n=1 Tax=Actinomycetospora chlora TaxID=663608 RepID=A0ABP9CDQ4_9PSEU
MIAQTDRPDVATVHVPAPRRAPLVPATAVDDHVELIAADIVATAALVNRIGALALLLALGLVAVLVLL